MTVTSNSRAAEIRSNSGTPVVDCDAHLLETLPVFLEYVRDTAGGTYADAFERSPAYRRFVSPWGTPLEERRRRWFAALNAWGMPTKNTLDRATASIPGLYASRMDDLGIDFSILYPSGGLSLPNIKDPEVREELVRAYNRWINELVAPHRDRMTVAAVIPMTTPDEAVRHLQYAVKELGHRVVTLEGYKIRPIADALEKGGGAAEYGARIDYFGIDSEYDYDPVWQACVDLKVAPTFHTPTGIRGNRSVSNYSYNHIGGFAQAQEGLAKALFFGGATHRFPTLNFGFLESGAGWACSLYADLVGHYERRNLAAMEYVDPANLDVEALVGYFAEYGDEFTRQHMDRVQDYYRRDLAPLPDRDDFWQVGLQSSEDVKERFVPRFYIGCEADDHSVGWAFAEHINPHRARIRATFSSDIGHWDVPDVSGVLEEAWELVEYGIITETDFREFVFTNPVELHAGMNPDFFVGTPVEADAAALLKSGRP